MHVICERCDLTFDSRHDPDALAYFVKPSKWRGLQVPMVLCARCRDREIEEGDMELTVQAHGA